MLHSEFCPKLPKNSGEDEKVRLKIKGSSIVDTVTNIKTGEKQVIKHTDNLIVNSVLSLLACALKGDEYAGISYWAIGKGHSSWDTNPVNPQLTETRLTAEIGRKYIEPENIIYVDPVTFEESSVPTPCLQVTTTFSENDCNGSWREFGLFGGNATEDKDSGIMLDKKHHELILKSDVMIIERVIRITVAFA